MNHENSQQPPNENNPYETNTANPYYDTQPDQNPEEERSIGSLIGIIIIVSLLVIGGLYFWGKQINDAQTAEEIMNQPDPQKQSLEQQGSSDDIESIESDLNATNLENLDQELQDIEEELENI